MDGAQEYLGWPVDASPLITASNYRLLVCETTLIILLLLRSSELFHVDTKQLINFIFLQSCTRNTYVRSFLAILVYINIAYDNTEPRPRQH